METTRLFTTKQVKKFFDIIQRLSMSCPSDKTNYPWVNYQTIYTKDSNHCPSEREVFVNRTINKWIKGKYLVLYRTTDLGITYKQYILVSSLCYRNDFWDGYIDVGMVDYTDPYRGQVFGGFKIRYNDALDLEGEWSVDNSIHRKLLEYISMDNVPLKEYVFNAYDWSRYPKRVKRGTDLNELLKTTKSFLARTDSEAYKKKEEFQKLPSDLKNQIEIGDLIDIRST